jgi:hypothetical protein
MAPAASSSGVATSTCGAFRKRSYFLCCSEGSKARREEPFIRRDFLVGSLDAPSTMLRNLPFGVTIPCTQSSRSGIVSRMFPILFLLISLAVATREIPELYNLADDPSNDGQVFSWESHTTLGTTHRVENEKRLLPARTLTFTRAENLKCTSLVLVRTGQDILRLVRSLRT